MIHQGLAAAREGSVSDAARFFEEALQIDRTDPEAWNNLGVVLLRQGDSAKGVEALQHALRIAPAHPEANRNLAVALDRLGEPMEAARHYRAFLVASVESHPDWAEVRRRLAELRARKGAE